MNISRTEARFKFAIFWWLVAALCGLTVATIGYGVGLWALGAFVGGFGTFVVAGVVLTWAFCHTDAEFSAMVAKKREAMAAMKPYRDANAAIVVPNRPKPGGPKVAPTVPKSTPKAAAAPAARVAPKADAAETSSPKPEAAPTAAQEKVGNGPAALSAPRAGGADDLKKIKGVGPKLEKQVNDLGIYHYDQIASWTAADVAWMDENLEGFKGRVSRDDWVAQARALAKEG